MRVNVVGLGKAGLPLAAVIADSGLEVTGLDIDEERIETLRKGNNPLPEEPGLEKILKERAGKNLNFTSSYEEATEEATSHIVIVPLFLKERQPDFTILKSAFTSLGKGVKKGDLVVLETTVPVGTTEGIVKDILERESGLDCGKDFHLAYSPERIMTGHSISRYKEFPKVVGGIDEDSTSKAEELYSRFCSKVETVKDCRTAELVKLTEGIYRDVNISLANELFKVCEEENIDFWEVREKANHQFCNIHEPGNVGGHCIPVYPWFLINEYDVPLIEKARELNDEFIEYYADKIKNISPEGKVCIVGLAYREGVKETSFSRSTALIEILRNMGYEVYGRDPMFNGEELSKAFGIDEAKNFDEMDAIIIMNKINKYNETLNTMKEKVVDVKNMLGGKS